MWLEIFLLAVAVWLLFKRWMNSFNYWKKKGFPHLKGTFPFGSKPNNIFINHYHGEIFKQIYDKLDPHPFGGYYLGRKPVLVARDPEFIKKVLVKDFQNFRQRSDFAFAGILNKNLFSAEGDLWRALRVKLTPTFTSGKLKAMFYLFQECSKKLDEHLKQLADNGEEFEVKDWMARFTTDIISTCAFGLEAKSLEKPDNELRKIGKLIFTPIRLRLVVIRVMLSLMPFLGTVLKFQTSLQKLEASLKNMIDETVTFREKNNITRNDFLDLLINIRDQDNLAVKKETESTNDEEINNLKMDLNLMTAQCFVFFAAGFETSSSVLTSCLYELTMNQEIQDKLRNEIVDVLKRYNGEITYQALHEMSYLDQVVNETMRKYPTLPFLTRICVKNYAIPEMNLVLDKGTRVVIPVYALHHDPKYYPEPDKFIPERFSPENKLSRPQFTFLPFGEGPRNCIGMRFGLLQTKCGIVTTVAKYKLLKSEKTPERLIFQPTTLITRFKSEVLMKIVHLGEDQ